MAVPTLPPQSYLGWKVSISILHVVAIISTLYRLTHRFRIRRSWWDDYVVFVPLAVDILYWQVFLFHRSSLKILGSYWLSVFPYTIIVWTTRIALSLSLARIFPLEHPARLWSFVLVAIMILSCIACVLTSTLSCKQSSLLFLIGEQTDCLHGVAGMPLGNTLMFASELASDILLVVSPLLFFWRLRLPPRERRLILMVFCGNIITILFVIAFATIALNPKISLGPDTFLLMAGLLEIEAAMSLLVCNLAIVSTCIYQLLLRRRNQERPEIECSSAETTPPRQNSSQQCTCLTEPVTLLTLTDISSFPPQSFSEHSSNRSRLSRGIFYAANMSHPSKQ